MSDMQKPIQGDMLFNSPAIKKMIEERAAELRKLYSGLNKEQLTDIAAENAAHVDMTLVLTDHLHKIAHEHVQFLAVAGFVISKLANGEPLDEDTRTAMDAMNKHLAGCIKELVVPQFTDFKTVFDGHYN